MSTEIAEQGAGTLETKREFAKSPTAFVKNWLSAIDLAGKAVFTLTGALSSIDAAAEMLNVSPSAVDRAKALVREAPPEVLQQAERDFDPLPFDAACARAFGSVAASLRARGRKVRARGLDALIAATAVANGLPLYTCHPGDFEAIVGLEVVAVPSPE